MYQIEFSLNIQSLNVVVLGSSCFYVTGNYKVLSNKTTVGNANFQSWVNNAGNGIGIMIIDLPSRGLFFLSTLDSYENGIFRHVAFGLSGGLLSELNKNIEYGSVRFRYENKKNIICRLRGYILRLDDKSNIPFYQNFVLTDPIIVTNTLKQGDLNSVFRVGELTIRNAVDNTIIGTNFFENYATPENNRGIGMSVYICANQILYSFLNLVFSPSIQDPNSTVSIQAVTVGGQKYLKNLIQGIDQTMVSENNYFETITGISRNISTNNRINLDCVLTKLQVKIFQFDPNEPKAVVRLGFYTIIDNLTNRNEIGTVHFQSYVTTNEQAIGVVIIQFYDKNGCIFGVYSTEFDSPVVIEPNSAQVSFTAGQGDFAQLICGYADLTSIPSTTDRKATITYFLENM